MSASATPMRSSMHTPMRCGHRDRFGERWLPSQLCSSSTMAISTAHGCSSNESPGTTHLAPPSFAPCISVSRPSCVGRAVEAAVISSWSGGRSLDERSCLRSRECPATALPRHRGGTLVGAHRPCTARLRARALHRLTLTSASPRSGNTTAAPPHRRRPNRSGRTP